jgi:hypothetical protein
LSMSKNVSGEAAGVVMAVCFDQCRNLLTC